MVWSIISYLYSYLSTLVWIHFYFHLFLFNSLLFLLLWNWIIDFGKVTISFYFSELIIFISSSLFCLIEDNYLFNLGPFSYLLVLVWFIYFWGMSLLDKGIGFGIISNWSMELVFFLTGFLCLSVLKEFLNNLKLKLPWYLFLICVFVFEWLDSFCIL